VSEAREGVEWEERTKFEVEDGNKARAVNSTVSIPPRSVRIESSSIAA
jgi:hypothetical protein